jgi:hypothetical protein
MTNRERIVARSRFVMYRRLARRRGEYPLAAIGPES